MITTLFSMYEYVLLASLANVVGIDCTFGFFSQKKSGVPSFLT